MANPNQAKNYCVTNLAGTVCDAACAVGCTTGNDPNACTTPTTVSHRNKTKKVNACKRCKTGFHPEGASRCVANAANVVYDCKGL